MDPELMKLALGGLAVLGSIGLFFGIGLALAAHKFAVENIKMNIIIIAKTRLLLILNFLKQSRFTFTFFSHSF